MHAKPLSIVIAILLITILFGCAIPQKSQGEDEYLKAINESDHRYSLALYDLDKSLNQAFLTNEPKLQKASHKVAKKLSSYNSCVKIVSLMAWDKVSSNNATEAYFQEEITPILRPANSALSQDVDAAILKFSEALRQNSIQLTAGFDSFDTNLNQSPISLNVNLSNKLAPNQELNKFSTEAFRVSGNLVLDRMIVLK